VAVARQIIGVSRAHRADEQLVAHRPAVDEEILTECIGARERRQRGKTCDGHAFAFRLDLHRIGAEVGAEYVAEPGEPPGRTGQRGGEALRCALLAGEREGDVGPAHGESAHRLAHRLGLGAIEFEEFQPRRRGMEQIAHLEPRTFPKCGRLDPGFDPGIDFDRPGMRLAGMARRDREPRHRADRGQRLAAETKGSDRNEIVVVQLRGGVAFDGKRQIGAAHALAVIGDADQAAPAAVSEDIDARRAGVECVLDQLLDHARRPLHDLARRDAVDDGFGELADRHAKCARRAIRWQK
jgi:hypothetical protein